MYLSKAHNKKRLTAHQKKLDDTLFKILEAHLKGEKQRKLRKALETLAKQENMSVRALYEKTYISPRKRRILEELLWVQTSDIPKKTNLLAWMEAHAKNNQGYRHLEDFDYLMTLSEPGQSWSKTLGKTAMSLTLTGIFLSVASDIIPDLKRILDNTLKITASVFNNTPLLLLVYNSIFVLVQTFYSAKYESFKTPQRRLQNWLAGTLRPAFSLTAYALCLTADGTFTPLSIAFIIASSMVNVIDSLWNFYQIVAIPEKPPVSAPLGERLNYIRQVHRLERAEANIAIDFSASVTILGLVIILQIFPPNLVLTAAITGCILIVAIASNIMNKMVHDKGARDLQNALAEEVNPGRKTRMSQSTTASSVFSFFSRNVSDAMTHLLNAQEIVL